MSSTETFGAGSVSANSVISQPTVEILTCRPARSLDRPLPVRVAAQLVVSLYRFISTIILLSILLALASYIVLSLFYFFSHSWMEPRVISPTDEHVLQLNNQLAQGTLLREQLATEGLELLVKMRGAQREVSNSSQFQHEVKRTAAQVVSDNLKKLATVQEVDRSYQSEAPKVMDSDRAFSSAALGETDKLYKSHLISEDEWLSRKAQLAQLSVSALSLQRNSAELDSEKNLLHREIDSYSSLLNTDSEGSGLSYNALQAKKELQSSLLERETAKDSVEMVSQEAAMIQSAIVRQDRVLLSIRNLPYLRAVEEKMTVAFVPYNNIARAKVGTSIYGCSAGIILCRRVGEVAEVLEGEVVDKHPFFNKELRGLLVRVQLDDSKWDQNQVLFLERVPLFF